MNTLRAQDGKAFRTFFFWEDGALSLMIGIWLMIGARMGLFHIVTLALMAMVFSVSLRQGALAGLLRTAVAATVVLLSKVMAGWSMHSPFIELSAMSGCGILAALLGGRERKDKETLKESFSQTLAALARALEARDPYTEGHSQRVAEYAVAIARQMGLSQDEQEILSQAGRMHDLGKIGASDAVLQKKDSLTDKERKQMALHPIVGEDILRGLPFLARASALVRHHHEHYDGSGYPDALAGKAIPLGARILAVADVFDALTTKRPYHRALNREDAIRQMESERNHFDPHVFEALKSIEILSDKHPAAHHLKEVVS